MMSDTVTVIKSIKVACFPQNKLYSIWKSFGDIVVIHGDLETSFVLII